MVFGSGKRRAHNDDLTRAQVLEECARLAGAPWEDPVFSAQGDRALYLRRNSTARYNNGLKIKWLRPEEINGATADISFIKDGIEAADVIQGELGDCYLLGAMASIASKQQLKRLVRSDAEVASDLAKGFITFTLYKYGEWVEVTVDTLVPCNASNEPIFAHCKDVNEVWVQMLEKAYAKLHGSYEALDGGSVVAALTDLTGGVGESIDFSTDDSILEIADGSMWRRLMRYGSKDNYLLGAANSQSAIPDNGSEGEVQVTDHGILVNHAYTLLAVKEVGEMYSEKTRLLQLRNPWGMREWEGPWRDHGAEWGTAMGQRARSELNVEFYEDGTFWIEWGDFQMHFNKVYVCRVMGYRVYDPDRRMFTAGHEIPEEPAWYRYEVEGAWTAENAGGCFNFPEWRKNPQYEIVTGESTDAIFMLMQPDPRLTSPTAGLDLAHKKGGDEGGPAFKKIGLYVMRGHQRMRRKVLYDSEEIEGDDVVDSTPFISYREVQCNTMDEESEAPLPAYQRFVLCPSTFAPGELIDFRMIIYTDKPLDQPPEALPRLNELSVRHAWTERTAGGCRNYSTWRKNDQFLLRLSANSRASVVMHRANAGVNAGDTALFSNRKAKSSSKKRKNSDATNFLIGFVVAQTDLGSRKKLTISEEEVIDKTAYTNNMEVSREFISDSGGEFVVVPSTFEPGKLAEFSLVVYTDDERASLKRIDPPGWHIQEGKGEWTEKTAGGCRNFPTWVRNPLFKLRSVRKVNCHAFLSQPELPEGSDMNYEGIGFYVTTDDGDLSLDDVTIESGFRMRQEVNATFTLEGDVDYLFIPMTYRRSVRSNFDIQIHADQPSLKLTKLSEYEADSRRIPALRQESCEAALTIQRWLARKQIWAHLRASPPNRPRAKELISQWFRKPNKDNDEGYLDINLALNALEAAFIQLTGKAEAKGAFFPRMRERLSSRGHKVADYDVCLPD
ncbi:hypothetical protein AB1Y20_000855 [Prymnesium parvum]|uniref:Calpain catalytic domain-containing protein n=1 Tax=Prymnesium parvum TaxID=97485 RepID=A0AB34K974_PRYPA